MAAVIVVLPEVEAAMIAHARAEAPNEACGLVAVEDNVAVRFFPARNLALNPEREFRVAVHDGQIEMMEANGCEIGVFHSHPHSHAYVSEDDWNGVERTGERPYFVYSIPTGQLLSARL